MRISDWSSDVCSSDLGRTLANLPVHERRERRLVETAVAKWCHKRRDGTLKHGIAPSPRPQIRYHAPMLLRARILAPDKDANPLLSRRSEEHTSELQSLMRNTYAVLCLKKKNSNIYI